MAKDSELSRFKSKTIKHPDGRECKVTYGRYGTEYREMGKPHKKTRTL
jgi:hypothetical protein